MIDVTIHPLQRAVAAAIGFPTTETLLCEGHTVNLKELNETLGPRLVIPKRLLCMSHVRSLASSIEKHGEVVVPIVIERKDEEYVVKDGFHRLAALDIVRKTRPDMEIVVKVKLS